jgi:hypothetical protein
MIYLSSSSLFEAYSIPYMKHTLLFNARVQMCYLSCLMMKENSWDQLELGGLLF